MSAAPAGAGETSQTLSRGLDVLALLASSPAPLTAAEVASRLGLSRTIVYRLLATLAAHGLAARLADGRFGVGLGVLGLSANLHRVLRDGARPALQALADDAGATAHLVLVDGADGVAVEVVEPAGTTVHLSYRIGSRFPLAQGGHGRALLAARRGRWEPVSTRGDLIPGVHGIAAAIPRLNGVEAAVGVISPVRLDAVVIGPRVLAAAHEVAAAF